MRKDAFSYAALLVALLGREIQVKPPLESLPVGTQEIHPVELGPPHQQQVHSIQQEVHVQQVY